VRRTRFQSLAARWRDADARLLPPGPPAPRTVNRGVVVLPKSVTEKRIIDNFKLIKLDEDDMATLNGLHKTKGKRFIKPECVSSSSPP